MVVIEQVCQGQSRQTCTASTHDVRRIPAPQTPTPLVLCVRGRTSIVSIVRYRSRALGHTTYFLCLRLRGEVKLETHRGVLAACVCVCVSAMSAQQSTPQLKQVEHEVTPRARDVANPLKYTRKL